MTRFSLLLVLALCLGVSEDILAQTNNLHYYTKIGDVDNVAHYINRHEDVNAFDEYGYTPLMYAADEGRNEIIKLLMDNGAEPNHQPLYDAEPPALHAAVLANRPETVDLMLQYERTKVGLLDSAGHTPLYLAVVNGYLECADVLIFHGADVNDKVRGRYTALQLAASRNDTAMLNLLIRNGADVNMETRGRTAFSVASEKGALQCARILMDRGADVHKGLPAHYAAKYADSAMISLLNDAGVDINGLSPDGYTPRDLAIMNSNQLTARKIASLGGKTTSALLIRYISISEFQDFARREFRFGTKLGIHEVRYNLAVYFGASFRPAYKPALVQERDHLYYQLREKRSFWHASIEKRFSFNNGAMPDWGASLAYEYAHSWGKYDGALKTLKPYSENFHVPCLGIYGRFRWVGMQAGYKYYGYSHALEAPRNVADITITGYIGFGNKKYRKF